jgi:hypothetical protein
MFLAHGERRGDELKGEIGVLAHPDLHFSPQLRIRKRTSHHRPLTNPQRLAFALTNTQQILLGNCASSP